MAYYGNQPIAGETNSFKVLDDISSYTKTFDGSSAAVVSTSDDTLTFYDHRFIQGQRVTYGKGSGGTVITGLTDATAYYVIREDKDTIKLATSASNASSNTAIDLTGVGGGTSHELTVAFDGTNTKFKATTGGGTHIKLTRPGQLMISMNGVVQEPQNNTPTNGFGIESNNVIVFSTAPTVLDTFWGHYLTSNLSSWEMSDNTVDNFTGNGSTTTYTLSKTPANAENILVTVDGVTQYPSESGTTRAYTLNASVVTFTTAPALNAAIAVRHIGFAGGSGGGSGGGGVTGFYGRTGNVTVIRSDLQNTDINLKNLTGVAATFTGNVSIGGTLTYTDVTNIDAVGIITAQQGIHLGAGATVGIMNVTTGISSFRQLNVVGISTFTDTIKLKADNKKLIFGTNSNLEIYSNGTDATINAASGAIKIQKGGTGLLTFDTGGSYFLDDVQIKSTDAGATGPILKLFHDSASPADNDIIGSISMSGDDDAGNETEYTAIKTKVTDVSNGVEQSHLSFYTRGLNAWNEIFRLNNRSSASAPSYTTDDHNGIILDVYNTGNPYPRYMNFIAKSAGDTDSNIAFWTEAVGGSPTEKLRITSAGRVGIGEDSPDGDLHIKNTNPAIILEGTNGSGRQHEIWSAGGNSQALQFTSGELYYNADSHYFRKSDETTEHLRITSTGKMGLGTNGDPTGGDFVVENTTGTAGIALSRIFSGNVASSNVNTPSLAFTMSDTATNDQVVASISPQALAGTGDAFKGLIRFFTANASGTNTERMRLNSTGHLTVGEANFDASNDIHIKRANAGGDVALRVTNNSNQNAGTTASLYLTTSPTQDFNTAYIKALRDGGKLNFGYGTDAPTVTMKVSTGQVGIGTDDPKGKYLQVGPTEGNTPGSVFTTTPFAAIASGNLGGTTGDDHKIAIFGGQSTGNVSGLSLYHYRRADGTDWTTDGFSFRQEVDNTANIYEYMNFAQGKIGIGTAVPNAKLNIYSSDPGSINPDADADELVIESGGNTGMSILSPGSGESSIYFGNPGTNGQKEAWLKYYHETHSNTAKRRALQIKAGGGEVGYFNSTGLVMSNDKGISFINADDTATGETVGGSVLDDYEYGTWVPTYTSTNATFAYSTQQGWYIKVGKLVTVRAHITTSSVSSTSHTLLKMSGLPFQVGYRTPCSVRAWGFQGSGYDQFPTVATFEHNQTFLEFLKYTSGGTTDYTTSTMNNVTNIIIAGSYKVD